MRPEGGQHDRCGILSREEERADDRGEGAVQGKVVPLHSISKAQAGTPVRGDTTAGIVSTEAVAGRYCASISSVPVCAALASYRRLTWQVSAVTPPAMQVRFEKPTTFSGRVTADEVIDSDAAAGQFIQDQL